MAAAYASFADEGVYRTARTYTKVTDASGKNIILDNTQNSYPAMKDMTAWYITDMLENTVNYGTGYGAKLENMTVAGKTGTTTSDFDRWFAGYTPVSYTHLHDVHPFYSVKITASLRLGMDSVLLAESAILLHFQTIGVILFVLHGVVVSLLAFVASERDLHSHCRHLLNFCLPA